MLKDKQKAIEQSILIFSSITQEDIDNAIFGQTYVIKQATIRRLIKEGKIEEEAGEYLNLCPLCEWSSNYVKENNRMFITKTGCEKCPWPFLSNTGSSVPDSSFPGFDRCERVPKSPYYKFRANPTVKNAQKVASLLKDLLSQKEEEERNGLLIMFRKDMKL